MGCYNTASGMSCCNGGIHLLADCFTPRYNTASGMSCCNKLQNLFRYRLFQLQYRKRYELLQRFDKAVEFATEEMLQYRKRYELLQQEVLQVVGFMGYHCYNTASGMSCCNSGAWEGLILLG